MYKVTKEASVWGKSNANEVDIYDDFFPLDYCVLCQNELETRFDHTGSFLAKDLNMCPIKASILLSF